MSRALITGILGQDGAYLAEVLLANGYEVFGLTRCRSGPPARTGLDHLGIRDRVTILSGDVTDAASVRAALRACSPSEVYNLAAQTSVGESWTSVYLTTEVNAIGAVNVMTAVLEICPAAAVFQASTSEMYARGPVDRPNRVDERTPAEPASPYGAAKLYAHDMARLFRTRHGLAVSTGIMFNHDSPVRQPSAVSRKIARAAAALAMRPGHAPLRLGSLDTARDRGHARDFARAMWLMLQTARPDDYVLATGRLTTIRDVAEAAFAAAGATFSSRPRQLVWKGEGLNEVGVDAATGEVLVEIDPALVDTPDALVGDAGKARTDLNWQPEVDFERLVHEMTSAEVVALRS